MASSLQEKNAQLAAEYASRNTHGDRLAEQEATIDLAKRKMYSDSLLFKRQQELWAEGIGSAMDLEQREMAYVSSVNSYRIARNRYRDLKNNLTLLPYNPENYWTEVKARQLILRLNPG